MTERRKPEHAEPWDGRERRTRPRVPTFACPRCQSFTNWVVDSRGLPDRDGIKRRRKCACGHTFLTYELPAQDFTVSP